MLPLKADQTALLVLDCQNAIVHRDGVIARAMGFAEMQLGTLRTLDEAAVALLFRDAA